jgi:hypothetical protein
MRWSGKSKRQSSEPGIAFLHNGSRHLYFPISCFQSEIKNRKSEFLVTLTACLCTLKMRTSYSRVSLSGYVISRSLANVRHCSELTLPRETIVVKNAIDDAQSSLLRLYPIGIATICDDNRSSQVKKRFCRVDHVLKCDSVSSYHRTFLSYSDLSRI